MGFVFIALIGLHIINNSRPLASHVRSRAFWTTTATTALDLIDSSRLAIERAKP